MNLSNVLARKEWITAKLSNVSETSVEALSTASGTIVSPSISISRTITALASGNQLMVYGYVRWTDIEGNTHPARNIEVQIMDEDVQFDDTRATVYTNNNGYYTANIDNQNDIFESGCDIYIRVNTANGDFEIGSGVLSTIFADGYYFITPVTEDVTTSQSLVTYSGSGTEAYGALSIHQALVAGYYYYEAMNDDDVNTIDIVYPGEEGSWSNSTFDLINIEYDDYCDWDVILHELGHQVATQINVDAAFYDGHYGDENLTERYGKSKGIEGAWSEGWASYFSMAAQNYYNSQVATISNVTNAVDNAYIDLLFNPTETMYSAGVNIDYSTYSGYGEGNESAVAYVLLYLVESVGLSHQELWDIAKESACSNLSDFMQTLYQNVDISLYSEIGLLLEAQNIADSPLVKTSVFSRTEPGTFYWVAADTKDVHMGTEYEQYSYYNDVVITFFDEDYNMVLQSSVISSALGTYGVPINSVLWNILVSEIESEVFYWCILTSQNSEPCTGPYYSSFQKAYFDDGI